MIKINLKIYLILISFNLFLFSCEKKEIGISDTLETPQELSSYSKSTIQKVYYNLCVENWNSGRHIGRRPQNYYEATSIKFNIPNDKVSIIESYYEYEALDFLNQKIRNYYKNNSKIELDYYAPISATAYCGVSTLKGKLLISDDENPINTMKEIIKDAPNFITGIKILEIKYKNSNSNNNQGFLWKRNEDLKIMESKTGLYSFEVSKYCKNWNNDEWNDGKPATIENIR